MEKNAFHSDLTAAVVATRPKSFANKKRKKRDEKSPKDPTIRKKHRRSSRDRKTKILR